jgi:hypothetical protein
VIHILDVFAELAQFGGQKGSFFLEVATNRFKVFRKHALSINREFLKVAAMG